MRAWTLTCNRCSPGSDEAMRESQDRDWEDHDSWCDMPNAIFYLTYNGIYNFTNGIGTQTQLLLRGLERLQPARARQYGPIQLHVVCPRPDDATWGYDPQFLQTQQRRLATLGGQLHFIQ